MYEAIAPKVLKHYVGLEVVGIDVLYCSFLMNNSLQSGYVFLMTVKGALLGPAHYITNMHLLPPAVPDEKEIEGAIMVSTSRLREAKVQQGRTVNGQGSGLGEGPR
jgi:hypothetical protein